jgi:hypothetical protein
MNRPAAFIFDLNGTMINDMEFHSTAWYDILNDELKAGLTREQVERQMYGKNEELLVRVFGEGRFTGEEMATISRKKELSLSAGFPAPFTVDSRPACLPGEGRPSSYQDGDRLCGHSVQHRLRAGQPGHPALFRRDRERG